MIFNPHLLARHMRMALMLTTAIALASCEHLNVQKNTQTGVSVDELSPTHGVVRPAKTKKPKTNLSRASSGYTVQTPSQIGQVPVLSDSSGMNTGRKNAKAPKLKVKTIDAYVQAMSISKFVELVFGEMLKVPYVTGAEVAKRNEIIQLRSSGEIKAQDFLELVKTALEEYGIRVVPENGVYRIVDDKVLRASMPRFIKSRARLRTRGDLRPVVQFVEMQAVDANAMVSFLQQAYGRVSDKLKFSANPQTNYVILSGLPENVDAALAIIRSMDELQYAGSQVRRYTPKYWDAEELGKELIRALTVEGWQVGSDLRITRSIHIMPVKYSNDLFIFSRSKPAQERVTRWLQEFDRPISGGDTSQIWVYQVENVDAVVLAETANSVLAAQQNQASLNGNRSGATSARQSRTGRVQTPRGGLGGRASAQDTGSGDPFGGGFGAGNMFSVDTLGNRIIFNANANEYDQYRKLLEALDTPAPEVLIEVQIAEVSLKDDTNFGVEMFIDDLGGSTVRGTAETKGLGLGDSGLTVGLLSGNVDATLNAFATNSRIKILSTPVLTARSGGSANIQVGTDVPIITSQRAANNQNGTGPTDVLQNIQYRKTGVILNIEPIVFGDNRIDLTITQEVSSTLDTANSGVASPIISNRSISTQLSLEDGATAVLGGLIQENRVTKDSGVPLLKDIPVVGQAFSADGYSVDRTELVVLITAYVLQGQADKNVFVEKFKRRIDNRLKDEDKLVTLVPKTF